MTEQHPGKCLLHNWAEERAVGSLDTDQTRTETQRRGHRGILTTDQDSKMEAVTTVKAVYAPPKGPGVRLRGVRGELLEKQFAQMIREKVRAEMAPPTPEPTLCSTTRTDFNADGFRTVPPEPTQVDDSKSEQAVSFWSENYQRIQRVTAVRSLNAPFRKSSHFSTPITERLEEAEPPAEN